jgi:hypothetical protein
MDHTDLAEVRDNSVLNVVSAGFSAGIMANLGTNTTIQNNRVLNAATLGSNGISDNATGTNCINNVVHRFSAALNGCDFTSGNLTPPN